MAANNDDIPPIPLPPAGTSIPPVEPPPVTPPAAPTAPETPVAPPSVAPPAPLPPVSAAPPAPLPPVAAARPDPYAQPGAQPTYAPPGAVPPAGSPPAYAAPAYGTPGAAYTPAAAGPPQGLALASMIVGIASVLLAFVSVGLLPAIAAVVLGHLAQRRQSYARPLWLTGLVTGYVGLGISLIWGLFVLIGIIAAFSDGYGY